MPETNTRGKNCRIFTHIFALYYFVTHEVITLFLVSEALFKISAVTGLKSLE